MTIPATEPLIHSHHTDVLPEEDPRAHTMIECGHCGSLVHADNNECMTTWVEWGPYVLCSDCFIPLLANGVLYGGEFAERASKRR